MNPFKSGDRVRLIDAFGDLSSDAKRGDLGTVEKIGGRLSPEDTNLVTVKMDDGHTTVRLASRFEPAPLKVGERVKVIGTTGHFAPLGTIGVVTHEAGNGCGVNEVIVRFPNWSGGWNVKDGGSSQYVEPKELERAPLDEAGRANGAVVYVVADSGEHGIPIGTEVVVDIDDYLLDGDYGVYSEDGRYDTYAPAADLDVEPPVPFALGDEVVIVESHFAGDARQPVATGKVIEIRDARYSRSVGVEIDRPGYSWWFAPAQLAPKPEPKPEPAFKVGDRVMVTKGQPGLNYATRGVVADVDLCETATCTACLVTIEDDGTNNEGFRFDGRRSVKPSQIRLQRSTSPDRGYLGKAEEPKVDDLAPLIAKVQEVLAKLEAIQAGRIG